MRIDTLLIHFACITVRNEGQWDAAIILKISFLSKFEASCVSMCIADFPLETSERRFESFVAGALRR